MHRLRFLIASLALLPILASGCGKTQTTVSSPTKAASGGAPPAQAAADTTGSHQDVNQGVVDSSSAGQQAAAENQTPLAPSPLFNDTAVQNLDSRLQEALRNFHKASDKVDRSTTASDVAKLGDAGVPKQQIASTLGYMLRDENSVEVKTDILDELGNLDDPAAFDQIVQALDQHQPDEVRTAAIEALDSLGDKRAIPVLQPLLTDRDEDIRSAAQSATDSLNDQ
jgi:HEAT repeat protein